jgi:hypothetical protein
MSRILILDTCAHCPYLGWQNPAYCRHNSFKAGEGGLGFDTEEEFPEIPEKCPLPKAEEMLKRKFCGS